MRQCRFPVITRITNDNGEAVGAAINGLRTVDGIQEQLSEFPYTRLVQASIKVEVQPAS